MGAQIERFMQGGTSNISRHIETLTEKTRYNSQVGGTIAAHDLNGIAAQCIP